MVRRCSTASISRLASCLNAAVAARSRLPITAADDALRSSTPGPAATARSAAIITSAVPSGMRTTSSAASSSAICTCATTVPFFCASPVKSSVRTALPSRCAAIARIAPEVTMPPPPMPANSARHGLLVAGRSRLPQRGGKLALARLPVRIGIRRARRTGDGDEARAEALQARQIDVAARRIDAALAAERGLHRLDRDAARLRGTVAAVLAHLLVDHDALHRLRHACRACGGGASRWRRPGRRSAPTRRRSRAVRAAPRRVRRAHGAWRRAAAPMRGGSRSASSATTAMRATPSAAICAAYCGTEKLPSAGWPPVIATASLTSSL